MFSGTVLEKPSAGAPARWFTPGLKLQRSCQDEAVQRLCPSSPLPLGRRKRLIGKGRGGRHLYDDEAPADSLVAGVARKGQLAIALGEGRAVLCLYRGNDRMDRIGRVGHELHRNAPIEVCAVSRLALISSTS